MNTKKHVLFLMLMLFVGAFNAALAGNSKKTEIRKVKNFDAVSVSTGIDLFLRMGDEKEVKVVADEDVVDNIITEVKNGTLRIYSKKSNFFGFFNFSSSSPRKVYVTVSDLKSIEASSGSDVKSENTLRGDALNVSSSSGSDVVLDVIYKDVSLSSSSGSDIRVTGKAKTVKAAASSGSDIDARNLISEICYANTSSGADISVFAKQEIHAGASSGGDIRYYGNPPVKNIEESSGGDVSGR
ncbi:Putative auto-transporter adhesin, head GIN domain [Mariniphaga anaerophila]|uniref:Putative auto-transporter adhesin, head GIN domain n=2 Tax=Mariniphaga anaerophila TaxID=1484053 RepID=A0A1M5BS38_9BACT|nr:Putative auto-transporter adhesin, head GIN domain [Mariniphaga anaerophila]